jgi:predicted cupin superfamily sugar epimerase
MHRLRTDEVFHFHLGDPVEQLQLYPDGTGQIVTIGTDLERGERPQIVVPAGVWQGARLFAGGEFALLGCTVAPGFEYVDYEHGQRAGLLERYGQFASLINELTTS